MARYANDLFMDAALDWLATDSDFLCISEGQPTTFTEAFTTFMLATIGITSGCWTKANGTGSGRKTTIAVSGGTVTNSGSANHMAVVDSNGSVLKYVFVLTEQYVTATNPITTPALYAEVQDPTAP
jgi:hypothetical protein